MREKQPVIRVLVVDDHALFRSGLRRLLEEDAQVSVVGEASTGGEAVEVANKTRPDVVVMDILMPDLDGINATREIKKERTETAVLMMSAVADEERIVQAIAAGADGYISKEDRTEAILTAITSAARGEGYLPPSLAKRVLDHVARLASVNRGQEQDGGLTASETDILRQLTQGKRNREIARSLGVSERTVMNHLHIVFEKLRITNRTQAIHYAVRHGIAERDA